MRTRILIKLVKIRNVNFGKSDTVRLHEHRICGQQTVLTSNLSTTRCRASSSSESISRRCTTLMSWNSVCCMLGMTLTRPTLTLQWTRDVDLFTHVSWQKTDTSNHYCDNIQPYDKTFQFLSNVTQCFFYKLLQIWTSNFPKVVWQHTEGTVGSIIWVLLEIYSPFQQWKNFENPLRIDKVIAMSLVYHFLGHSVDINYY